LLFYLFIINCIYYYSLLFIYLLFIIIFIFIFYFIKYTVNGENTKEAIHMKNMGNGENKRLQDFDICQDVYQEFERYHFSTPK